MKHLGGCLCGEVRFEAAGKPRAVFHCHCFSCRRQTGAVLASFAVFLAAEDGFRWTQAMPAVYQSSPGVTRSFCPRCGTPVSYQAEKYPGEIHLNLGTMDLPEHFEPTAHYFVAEKISWLETADQYPRYPHDSLTGLPEEESWGADEA